MKRKLLSLLLYFTFLSPVAAADIIGLSLPLTGQFAPVAERLKAGAEKAVKGLKQLGHDIELAVVDDGCEPKTASETAAIFEQAGAKVVVGPVCFSLAVELSKALAGQDGGKATVPVLSYDDRNSLLTRLREVDGLSLFSLSGAPDAEARAVVDLILPRFAGKPFALLDDGSVYGRALADAVRLLGEEVGLKPIANANFRPLQSNQFSVLRRLQKSGVEAVFIAAAPEDVATIAGDIKALGFDWQLGTGEQASLLKYAAENPTSLNGLMMVRETSYSIVQDRPNLTEKDAEDSLLAGYTLVEIAAQALKSGNLDLSGKSFQTVIGPVTFDTDGRAAPAPFLLQKWENGAFAAVPGN